MKQLVVAAAALVCVVWAAACDEPCCRENGDCVDGARCFEGVCALRCEADSMCNEGEICSTAGVCRDAEFSLAQSRCFGAADVDD
ncbi:MAG: hypothetical protein Q8O67_27290 [Deltaproteobacteria bacterium]|nr:hypothetical protein [Deltaproteobacteria bacterium]